MDDVDYAQNQSQKPRVWVVSHSRGISGGYDQKGGTDVYSAEQIVVHTARISSDNPANKDLDLLKFLMKHKHWSPFEMAHVTLAVWGFSRNITRQLLRHKGFSVQELSQRYKKLQTTNDASVHPLLSSPRKQSKKNRQSSIPVSDDPVMEEEWTKLQISAIEHSNTTYNKAIDIGIGRELARNLLPEGYTQTYIYVSGNIRQWLTYFLVRMSKYGGTGVQHEHEIMAEAMQVAIEKEVPICMSAFNDLYLIKKEGEAEKETKT